MEGSEQKNQNKTLRPSSDGSERLKRLMRFVLFFFLFKRWSERILQSQSFLQETTGTLWGPDREVCNVLDSFTTSCKDMKGRSNSNWASQRKTMNWLWPSELSHSVIKDVCRPATGRGFHRTEKPAGSLRQAPDLSVPFPSLVEGNEEAASSEAVITNTLVSRCVCGPKAGVK